MLASILILRIGRGGPPAVGPELNSLSTSLKILSDLVGLPLEVDDLLYFLDIHRKLSLQKQNHDHPFYTAF